MTKASNPSSSPCRTYTVRTILFMGGYALLNVLAILGVHEASPAIAWFLALCITCFVAAHIWAFLIFIRDSDEYVRALTAKRFIVSAGAVIAGFTGWGFCEVYAGAPDAPAYLIYPFLWVAFAITTLFIKTSRS